MRRMDAGEMRESSARCIALTQEHRGHGMSTAAYYLARVLVSEGLRVLLIDLTGRRTRLQGLVARGPAKNLGVWMPPIPRPAELQKLLAQAREQTRGRVDVLLLDVDQALLEHAGGLACGIDYVLTVVEPTDAGQNVAERIDLRLGDDLPPYGRVGVVFSRVDATTVDQLPEQTAHRKLRGTRLLSRRLPAGGWRRILAQGRRAIVAARHVSLCAAAPRTHARAPRAALSWRRCHGKPSTNRPERRSTTIATPARRNSHGKEPMPPGINSPYLTRGEQVEKRLCRTDLRCG